MSETRDSIFLAGEPAARKLERARDELLDLSTRNRLLSIPQHSRNTRTIGIVDEKPEEVFRLLVREGKSFTFVPGRADAGDKEVEEEDAEEIESLAQPGDDSRDDRGVLNRHADTKLQTRLTSGGLQKRLLDLYQDARTLEDEQGVNILYLALGTLRWSDPHSKTKQRVAPLVLVPVTLERASARERFRLKWRQEDCSENLSLEAFLNRVHTLKMPPFPAGDEFSYPAYAKAIAETIAVKEDWWVAADDIVLGFFSYAKFLMYRDLDPATWPAGKKLTESRLIRALLSDGFETPAAQIAEDSPLDGAIRPAQMRHVHDSDSSQVLAAFDARSGRDLVIQGPPGTGKSQTIANIVAEAVADGKRVLFVCEKMAALEVVKRRLDQAGVGEACLELHSNKANKRALLEELRRTWELGAPKGPAADAFDRDLEGARELLNAHLTRMHGPQGLSGVPAFDAVGRLAAIQRRAAATPAVLLKDAAAWGAEEWRQRLRLLDEITTWIKVDGIPAEHVWWGAGIDSILPLEAGRIAQTAGERALELQTIADEQAGLAQSLDLKRPENLRGFASTVLRAQRIGTAPAGVAEHLAAVQWEHKDQVDLLLEAGSRLGNLTAQLQNRISNKGWTAETETAHQALTKLPGHLAGQWFEWADRLEQLIPQLVQAADAVRESMKLEGNSSTAVAVRATAETARHVAAAPDASPGAFTAAVWDHGVEQAADLVEAVGVLEAARRDTGERVADAAWDADCAGLRQTLAAHGTGWLRWFSGAWRQADRTAKSLLRNPATPLPEVLRLLDEVARGQKARQAVHEGDSLGAAAFGAQWRGDRSASAPLRALAEWAKGLGARSQEIRALAAHVTDRARVQTDASCLATVWHEAEILLPKVAEAFFAEDWRAAERCTLEELRQRAADAGNAEDVCRKVFATAPETLSERVRLLDDLHEWRRAGAAVQERGEIGRQCFGSLWNGAESDWSALHDASNWVSANGDIRHIAARFPTPQDLVAQVADVAERTTRTVEAIERLFQDVQLDCAMRFETVEVRDIPCAKLIRDLTRWSEAREGLSKWVVYASRSARARELGLGDLCDRLAAGKLPADEARVTAERAYYWAVLAEMVRQDPELARFDGSTHQRHVDEFVRLEHEHQRAARVGAMRAHYERIPHGGAGPVGVLKAEIGRRRGHMPIRQLMASAGPAVQALKPVLMMSPLSVAQFLTPGEMTFDLLVMDEASQIQPVDALGAIARCGQAVIVGDERQLPPTRFFSRMTGGTGEEEDGDAAQIADVESILGLFLARGVPQRTLRWHYRSEHHSLIAVSNSEFYENRLCVLPSPYTLEAGRGVRFRHVPDGVYDSGNTRANVIEAQRVAEAVMEHAKRDPRLSLGVGTFSVAQRRAILEQLERMRRQQPATEEFFLSHPNEPFFVKNLENIQGDERDVIFISVGYAKNSEGQMAMRFGPLSSQGGERRLNVLITRAKRRCEVFASITDRDIDTARASGKGVAAFQLFLRFARTGVLQTADAAAAVEESRALEEDVAAALRSRGYETDTHVGLSGAVVDVAVLDPGHRGRYVLGIECDGLSYASARCARDRDRLRGQALERQGWRLHRVWSMDWYQRPAEQLETVVKAIELAKAELNLEAEQIAETAPEVVEREEVRAGLGNPDAPGPAYAEASPTRPAGGWDLLGTPVQTIAEMVIEIVEKEGPVHQDEVAARVRSAWGLQRTGVRIQEHVTKAIRAARIARGLTREGKFLSMPGGTVRLRNRSGVVSRSLRLPEMLPPAEIRAGVVEVVRENFAAREEEVVNIVLRRLGYAVSSANLKEAVESVIEKMQLSGALVKRGDWLAIAEGAAQ